MKKLFLSNKSWPDRVKDNGKIAGVKVSEIIKKIDSFKEHVEHVGTPNEATHAIIHETDELYDKFEKEELKTIPEIQILLVASTEEPGNEKRKHLKKVCGNKTRYVLYARYTSELNKTDVLQAFCRMSADQAEAVYTQNISNVPGPLLRLFGLFSMDSFFALNILCQGYLLLHPNLVEQLDPELRDSVRNALTGNNGLQKIIDYPSTAGVDEINAAPSEDRQWWKDVLEEDKCVLDMMKKEYENMKFPWDDNSCVASLCKWIDGENIDENLELTVAKAYLELLKILEK
jgi:hypothetical protein